MSLELNIAICDDEIYYRRYIKKLISGYLISKDIVYHIQVFNDGSDFCKEENNIQIYDIIFLDIGMKDMNGMETAYRIREKNREMDIVFITVMPEYVFEGYRVGAVRYILKRELEKLLFECIEALLKRRRYNGQRMEFEFVGGKRKVALKEILYIESRSHKLYFIRKGESLYLYGQINELEMKMSKYNFMRCHQSYLVNLEYIDKINNYWIYLSDETRIPVSRSRYAEVRQQFLRYKEV